MCVRKHRLDGEEKSLQFLFFPTHYQLIHVRRWPWKLRDRGKAKKWSAAADRVVSGPSPLPLYYPLSERPRSPMTTDWIAHSTPSPPPQQYCRHRCARARARQRRWRGGIACDPLTRAHTPLRRRPDAPEVNDTRTCVYPPPPFTSKTIPTAPAKGGDGARAADNRTRLSGKIYNNSSSVVIYR